MTKTKRVGGSLRTPPSCASMGPQCRQLEVTLRVGGLEDGIPSLDHEGTWLLGHTQQLDFQTPRVEGQDLQVDAKLHLRCRHLKREGTTDRCAAHGFAQRTPAARARPAQPRRLGPDEFILLEGLQPVPRTVLPPAPSPRALPPSRGAIPASAPSAPPQTTSGGRLAAETFRSR